ncbi:Rtt106-domain-containing protein [Trichoderma citrinoviride]|uniref:Rtt106-domain-containing protein n=1 Tax=Trichoderma citrinoviride TaxID=58853 RepID=A0A2T4B1G9_9HYPO|nr:Rtt106-domain-containing protein [Trichoderma citrinoviride]PTB63172.1 Rtt106-domain-containing protein [Trichoderma citrinoviride]
MAQSLNSQRISAVFQARPDIIASIKQAADSPSRIALFNNIADHVYERLQENGEPAQKKRKVGAEQQANGSPSSQATLSNAADEDVLLEVKEISVVVPQRKKLEICFTANHLYARAPGTTAPLPGISYAWRDIEYAFFLPVPDKAQVQHNYVIFPKGTCLPSKAGNPPSAEPFVFTVPITAPKQGTVGGSEAGAAAAVSDTYKSLFHWALSTRLQAAGNGVKIVSADPNKFRSMVRQPHRPNETAVHVSGFRGSKDGFLFFLENGILWGFKKPLIFIPINRIAAISYTNILQITFNILVEVFTDEEGNTEELEFGMLDQQDYGGIDEYVKMNGLQDRSMAEQRKAKLQLAENKGPKKKDGEAENGEAGAVEGEGDGMTELERAQHEAEQQLQDEEDEDEEDYDPGSEGDSEGSGSSDDDDDDDDDDDEDDDEDDEEEGEGENEGEPEEEEEKIKEEPPKPPAAKEVKTETPNVPVRSGWAAFTSRPAAPDVDMAEGDDEKFDVVG